MKLCPATLRWNETDEVIVELRILLATSQAELTQPSSNQRVLVLSPDAFLQSSASPRKLLTFGNVSSTVPNAFGAVCPPPEGMHDACKASLLEHISLKSREDCMHARTHDSTQETITVPNWAQSASWNCNIRARSPRSRTEDPKRSRSESECSRDVTPEVEAQRPSRHFYHHHHHAESRHLVELC